MESYMGPPSQRRLKAPIFHADMGEVRLAFYTGLKHTWELVRDCTHSRRVHMHTWQMWLDANQPLYPLFYCYGHRLAYLDCIKCFFIIYPINHMLTQTIIGKWVVRKKFWNWTTLSFVIKWNCFICELIMVTLDNVAHTNETASSVESLQGRERTNNGKLCW